MEHAFSSVLFLNREKMDNTRDKEKAVPIAPTLSGGSLFLDGLSHRYLLPPLLGRPGCFLG